MEDSLDIKSRADVEIIRAKKENKDADSQVPAKSSTDGYDGSPESPRKVPGGTSPEEPTP